MESPTFHEHYNDGYGSVLNCMDVTLNMLYANAAVSMGAAPKLCSEHESRLEVNGSTGIGAVACFITNRVLLHYEHGLLLSKKFIDKILL